MLIGRIVFGLGGECLNVCQTAIVVKWFFKSESAVPLGLSITLSRMGSVLNDVISPRISGEKNASSAFWLGFVMTIISFISIVVIFIIDYAKDKAMNEASDKISQQDVVKVNMCELVTEFKKLNKLFWILTMLCLSTYGCVLPFNYIATGFFTSTTLKNRPPNEARKIAGVYMGVPFFIGAIMVPIFGGVIDKFGNRTIMALISGVMWILLGVSYSIFASVIWPSISIAVNDKERVGLAYGITTSFQSLGLAIHPMIVASLLVGFGSYNCCLLFFAFLGFVSMLFGMWLVYENQYNKKGLLDQVKFEDEEEIKNCNKYIVIEEEKNYKTFDEEKFPLKK